MIRELRVLAAGRVHDVGWRHRLRRGVNSTVQVAVQNGRLVTTPGKHKRPGLPGMFPIRLTLATGEDPAWEAGGRLRLAADDCCLAMYSGYMERTEQTGHCSGWDHALAYSRPAFCRAWTI